MTASENLNAIEERLDLKPLSLYGLEQEGETRRLYRWKYITTPLVLRCACLARAHLEKTQFPQLLVVCLHGFHAMAPDGEVQDPRAYVWGWKRSGGEMAADIWWVPSCAELRS